MVTSLDTTQVHNIGLAEVAVLQEGVQEVISRLGQNTSFREFASLMREDVSQVVLNILCVPDYLMIQIITVGVYQCI